MKKLDKDDIEFIKKSDMSTNILSKMLGCSEGAVSYHRNRGIWIKKKQKKW